MVNACTTLAALKRQPFVETFTRDTRGLWLRLRRGWCFGTVGNHLLHEANAKDMLAAAPFVRAGCDCESCLKGSTRAMKGDD